MILRDGLTVVVVAAIPFAAVVVTSNPSAYVVNPRRMSKLSFLWGVLCELVCGRGLCAAQTAPHTAAQSDNAQRCALRKCTVSSDVCLCLEADLFELWGWMGSCAVEVMEVGGVTIRVRSYNVFVSSIYIFWAQAYAFRNSFGSTSRGHAGGRNTLAIPPAALGSNI